MSSSSSIERKYIYGETSDDEDDRIDIKRQERGSDEERGYVEEEEEESHYAAPKMRPYGNTGPKGVLQDYHEAEEKMAQKEAEKRREALLLAEKNSFALNKEAGYEDDDDEIEKLLAEAEGDDDGEMALAFELYRKQRLLEEYKRIQDSKSSNVRTLGTYDYMSTVQDADPDKYVVIHVYSDAVGSCRPIGKLLEHLSQDRILGVRCEFYRISGKDSLDSFPEAVMPVVLVYKRGSLVQCHMRLRAPASLIDALKEDGVIKSTERISVPPELLKEDEFDGGYDEGDDEDDDSDDDYY